MLSPPVQSRRLVSFPRAMARGASQPEDQGGAADDGLAHLRWAPIAAVAEAAEAAEATEGAEAGEAAAVPAASGEAATADNVTTPAEAATGMVMAEAAPSALPQIDDFGTVTVRGQLLRL